MLLQVCGCRRRRPPPLLPVFPVVAVFFLFLSLGKAAVSPVITGCVSEVSGRLRVSLWEAAPSPPPASVLGLASRCRWEALARVIALWGIAPYPVCLSVYLSALVCQPVRPSLCVTLLPRRSPGLVPSVPFARPQTDTVFFFSFFEGRLTAEEFTHARAVISVNISHHGMADSRPALVSAETPGWCPLKWA